MARFVPVVSLAVVVLAVASGRAQRVSSTRFDEWRSAIELHAAGQRDEPVQRVSLWRQSDLDSVRSALNKFSGLDERERLLKKAVLLHTDILVLLHDQGGYHLPGDGRQVAVVLDGTQLETRAHTIQWEFTRELIESLSDTPANRQLARRWYGATAAFLGQARDWAETKIHLPRATALLENDAEILVYEGAMHEEFAAPVTQAVPEVQAELGHVPQVRLPTTVTYGVLSSEAEWHQAEALFRRAINISPTYGEAHVRLGHVLGELGRHAQAISELQQGLAYSSGSAILLYWALLFLGREQRAVGDPLKARDAFIQAVALFPEAESPRLALSELAYEAGNTSAALEQLQVTFIPPARRTSGDPRLTYETTHVPGAEVLLAELREALVQ